MNRYDTIEDIKYAETYTEQISVINSIFDSLGSMKCESCRHFQNKINEEEIACNYHCGFFPLKYKYCGHWESVEDIVENFSKMVHRDYS
jgi:hypothetical protein